MLEGSAKAIDVIYLQREVEWIQQAPLVHTSEVLFMCFAAVVGAAAAH